MQTRHLFIAVAVAAGVIIFVAITFFSLNQAPTVDGSATSTQSENRGNDTGIAAPAGPANEAVSPPE